MIKIETDMIRILLVDDVPTNLTILSESLRNQGWMTLFATDGEAAVEQADYAKPDLILLDVMMPGIDGFETCRRLKANPTTKTIPVIFMTALSDTVNKLKGLKLGAVDYITKPFQEEEVVARVEMQLNLYHVNKQLENNNILLNQKIAEQAATEAQLQQLTQELEYRVQARTQELTTTLKDLKQAQMQLVQSEKMSSLGQMVAGIAHEINNPVSFIYGNLRYARDYFKDLFGLLEHYQKCYPNPEIALQEHIDSLDLSFMTEDAFKLLESLNIGAERIREIVLSLRNFSRLDEAELKLVNLHEGLDSTLLILKNKLHNTTSGRAIEIVKHYGDIPEINCYPSQLNQVFMNILANAIDAVDEYCKSQLTEATSPFSPTIKIVTELMPEQKVKIQIIDNGPGISEDIRAKIFDPFFTTKTVGKGTGLGLSISHQIVVEKHKGDLSCLSEPGQGTRFVITVPFKDIKENQ